MFVTLANMWNIQKQICERQGWGWEGGEEISSNTHKNWIVEQQYFDHEMWLCVVTQGRWGIIVSRNHQQDVSHNEPKTPKTCLSFEKEKKTV